MLAVREAVLNLLLPIQIEPIARCRPNHRVSLEEGIDVICKGKPHFRRSTLFHCIEREYEPPLPSPKLLELVLEAGLVAATA